MTLSAIVPLGVGGLMLLPAVGNDNFVCWLPFVSLSFAGMTFSAWLRRFPDFSFMVGVTLLRYIEGRSSGCDSRRRCVGFA
jgi:hypothetical protein